MATLTYHWASDMRPNPDKIEPTENAASPTTLKQLQTFLGAVNYLSEFVPRLADLAEPLPLLIRKGITFTWGAAQEASFQQLKNRHL